MNPNSVSTFTMQSGLSLSEFLTLIGIIIGPIVAVVITLVTETFRRRREQRIQILRMLLNTRAMPSDPAYVLAINLVPVEFNNREEVMRAWREYIQIVRYKPTSENAEAHQEQVRSKQAHLIFTILQALGLKLSEGEIQTEAYISEGFAARDRIYIDSLIAMRDIATAVKRSADLTEKLVERAVAAQNQNPTNQA